MSTFAKKNLISDLISKTSLAQIIIYQQEESMAYIMNPSKKYRIVLISLFCLKKGI